MTPQFPRRTLLQGTGAGALALLMSGAVSGSAQAAASQRAVYHMTPPSGWLCDPQRPVYTNGGYQLYYLHSSINNGQGGWDHATTTDAVSFSHHGVVLPQLEGDDLTDVALVVDNEDPGHRFPP